MIWTQNAEEKRNNLKLLQISYIEISFKTSIIKYQSEYYNQFVMVLY